MIAAAPDKRLEIVRIAAAGAVAAVTLLWAGRLHPVLFQAGSVLLSVCLIPLASGLGARGGSLLGLLFGAVWITATYGTTDIPQAGQLVNWVNLAAMAAMTVVGGLAGRFLAPIAEEEAASPARAGAGPSAEKPIAGEPAGDLQRRIDSALLKHREWMNEWDRHTDPWASFDQHVRAVLATLTGARRIRTYRLNADLRLQAISRSQPPDELGPSTDGLIGHVLTTRRRYLGCDPSTPPLIRQLAGSIPSCPAWIFSVCHLDRPVGLVTVGEFDTQVLDQDTCDTAAELVAVFWRHVHEADELRLARLTDQASGLLSRTQFMGALTDLARRSREMHEPFVVLTVCLEGLRRLDDAGDWRIRDQVVEMTGQAVRSALRRDDLVGRFSDALFVAVLRRLDVPLAELITQNLVKNVEQAIAQMDTRHLLTLRAGLSGSGLQAVPADALLRAAFAALEVARSEQRPLATDPASEAAAGVGS